MAGNVLAPPWLTLISSWQRGGEMSGHWHQPTCTQEQHGSEAGSGKQGGKVEREGKILISVDLIKTGVNRWGRWSEVQQETVHLSGFPHFSFYPSIFSHSPHCLISALSFGFHRVLIQSFNTGNVTNDKTGKINFKKSHGLLEERGPLLHCG